MYVSYWYVSSNIYPTHIWEEIKNLKSHLNFYISMVLTIFENLQGQNYFLKEKSRETNYLPWEALGYLYISHW